MAYDETIHEIPRFNERELYALPEIHSGEVDLPQRFLDGAIKLQKHDTSPIIEEFVQNSLDEGRLVVVKTDYKIPTPEGDHTVAWCRICDSATGVDHYQIVCDHVGEFGAEALEEELLFACHAVNEAVMIRSIVVKDKLGSQNTLADATKNYGGRRGVVRFMLDYGSKQPHNWLVSHRSDAGFVDGYATLLDITPTKMRRMAKLMALEGDIEVGGPDERVITFRNAA